MEPDPTGKENGERLRRFPLDDPQRVEIYAKLRLVGPGPASFYRDACRLLDADYPVDTVTHLVGHCVREIESALRQVLKATVVAQSAGAGAGQQSRSSKKGGQKDNHDTDIRACLAALEIGESEDISQAWLTYAGGIHGRAHRDALNPPRPLDEEFIEFFRRMESVLRAVLSRFETKFGSAFPLIDELLARERPTGKDAEHLKQDVPNTLVTHYRFFDGIPDGRWLGPLEEEGFFSAPPGSEASGGGESRETGYPPWPQSRYLARIAPDESVKVKEIFLGLPATENVRVHEDMARAAREMPAHHAAELAPRVKEGLDSPYYSPLALELARLVTHLSANEQPETALDLAVDLLALVPDRIEESSASLGAVTEPRPRFLPSEDYAEVLDTCVEPLADGVGEGAVGMLCGVLAGALRVRLGLDEDDDTLRYADRLYMDRPAVEDHPYNRERGLNEGYTGRLLAAVRDAAERLCERDAGNVGRLVGKLGHKPCHT